MPDAPTDRLICFYDDVVPALPDGDYTITVQQDVTYTPPGGSETTKTFQVAQAFSVRGPRFALDPADVHSSFPPDGSQGTFEEHLPQIVFTKRALPWERTLTSDPSLPWLALLLFDETEIVAPPPSASSGGDGQSPPDPTRAGTYPLSQVLQPGGSILGPNVTPDTGESDTMPVQAIDISTDTFRAVTPLVGELKYLAHARQVTMGDKVLLSQQVQPDPGWFATVIGNRLPSATPFGQSAPPADGNRQIAHLVSLEGFEPYLATDPANPPAFPPGIDTARLVTLAGWSFTTLPETGQTFAELAENLVSDASEAGTDLLLKLPLPAGTGDADVRAVLDLGYVPLSYQTRPGDQTFAWVRGPLTPVLPPALPDQGPLQSPSQALIYDATTGLLDQSYAVAFETGRLLALADRRFGGDLLAWRRQGRALVDLLVERLNAESLQSLLQNAADVEELHDLVEQNLVSSAFMSYLLGDFTQNLAPTLGAPREAPPAPIRPAAQPAAGAVPADVVQQLRDLLGDPDVQALLRRARGFDGNRSPPVIDDTFLRLAEWLARLALLYGVPFGALVPDARLLPTESLRFFYVDPNALDCLVDGAMSIGGPSSRDSLYYEIMRGVLRDTVSTLVGQVRQKLEGQPITTDPPEGPMAGFLLRSALVFGWPGLEVRAFESVDTSDPQVPEPTGPIPLLRMDRLAPDVLLCLFPEVPRWVQIDEPQEGLKFGVEDGGTVYLRYVSGGELGQQIPNQAVQPGQRAGSPVLDVAALLGAMQTGLGLASALSVSEFTLQMVKAPERMVFQNPS
jgi:hypothetical protein